MPPCVPCKKFLSTLLLVGLIIAVKSPDTNFTKIFGLFERRCTMKKASYTVNFIDIDLSKSVRANYLERNRITLEAIVQRFSPNALYKVMDDGKSLVIVTSDVVDVAGLAKRTTCKCV